MSCRKHKSTPKKQLSLTIVTHPKSQNCTEEQELTLPVSLLLERGRRAKMTTVHAGKEGNCGFSDAGDGGSEPVTLGDAKHGRRASEGRTRLVEWWGRLRPCPHEKRNKGKKSLEGWFCFHKSLACKNQIEPNRSRLVRHYKICIDHRQLKKKSKKKRKMEKARKLNHANS